MTAVTTDRLIAPHGGVLVDRTGEAPADLDSLDVVTLTSRELSDLDMIASGALSPLQGFMGRADYERVVDEMHLAISPVLLGRGESLLADFDLVRLGYRCSKHSSSAAAIHVVITKA